MQTSASKEHRILTPENQITIDTGTTGLYVKHIATINRVFFYDQNSSVCNQSIQVLLLIYLTRKEY